MDKVLKQGMLGGKGNSNRSVFVSHVIGGKNILRDM